MKDEWAAFVLAVQFLTRVPIRSDGLYTPARMAASPRYYPLVGALVGAACAGVLWTAALALPWTVAVMLAVAAGLLLTGGFHEDGLADTADGIGGGRTREEALAIMRDSRLGTYGTLALIMVLGLTIAALAGMPADAAAAGLIAAHGLSRFSSIVVIATSRYVRADGAGKPVAEGISRAGFFVAGGTALLLLGGLAWRVAPLAAAAALVGAAAGHLAMRAVFERKLGGYTGDALGAVQQASALGVYLGLAAWS